MKYLKYMVIGTLLVSGMFAKELPEDQAWNNFRFAPKLAGDAPAYSLINVVVQRIAHNCYPDCKHDRSPRLRICCRQTRPKYFGHDTALKGSDRQTPMARFQLLNERRLLHRE